MRVFVFYYLFYYRAEEPRGFLLDAVAAYFLAGNLPRNKIVEVLQGSREVDYKLKLNRKI